MIRTNIEHKRVGDYELMSYSLPPVVNGNTSANGNQGHYENATTLDPGHDERIKRLEEYYGKLLKQDRISYDVYGVECIETGQWWPLESMAAKELGINAELLRIARHRGGWTKAVVNGEALKLHFRRTWRRCDNPPPRSKKITVLCH